jgi:hypothetical protein
MKVAISGRRLDEDRFQGDSSMPDQTKPTCSEAKMAANRLNALKSTGPKTVEGKERSRQNALTHGFCASVIQVPGEDPEVLIAREADWQAELNPQGRAVQGYLVHAAVRQTGQLDRIYDASQASAATRVRDAHAAAREAKLRDIDTYSHMIDEEHCNVGVRRLMLTAEGCEWLINEWNLIRPALEPSMHWDGADEGRSNRIAGNSSVMKKITPSPYALATIAITAYREVATRIKDNEFPEGVAWEKRYKSTNWKERDLQKIGPLYEKAEPYRLWLIKEIDGKVAKLTALKLEHEAADARHAAEVPIAARVDLSDQGKLMHRYEQETHRAILRGVKEIQTMNRNEAKSTQVIGVKPLAKTVRPASTPAPPSRNEPTAPRRPEPFPTPSDASTTDFAFVPINITRDPALKNQR